MLYAYIINGLIDRVTVRPDWTYADTGLPVDDNYLKSNGVLPVLKEIPTIDEFYQVYTEKPKEEWTITENNVIVTFNITDKTVDEVKQDLIDKIKILFYEKLSNGKFMSSLGFETDSRRANGKNDKDNLESLILLGVEPITWKDANGAMQSFTLAQANTLKIEMIQYGLGLYQQKWALEDQVNNATTINELKNINLTFN